MLWNLWSDFRHAARTLKLNPGFAAAVFVLGAALLAGFVPARRATRVDPTTTLRHE